MSSKKQRYSDTYIKNLQRFQNQRRRLQDIQRNYSYLSNKFYGRNKRHNLVSNIGDTLENVNPWDLSPTELARTLRRNTELMRDLGGFRGSGRWMDANILVSISNDALESIEWSSMSQEYYDVDYVEQQRQDVFGEMLLDSLKQIDLSESQIRRLMSKSNLDVSIKRYIEYELLEWNKQVKKRRK